ncbi:hypothetical protein PRIPAC_90167, partial [Pristionchus pacificus]|uniref:Uncharacterized protein n=1 Tax=Pristionchus pacificus TaxID=54126 RepID=A0A2A6B641_PRIPA
IPSLVSLLLVAVATISITVSGAMKFDKLDLSACYDGNNKAASDLVCYVPGYCARRSGEGAENDYVLVDPTERLAKKDDAENKCPAAVVLKKFSDRKWLVSLMLINNADKREITIKLSGQPQFGCTSDDKNRVVVGDRTGSQATYKIETYSLIARKAGILCKFTIEGELGQILNRGDINFEVFSLGRTVTKVSNIIHFFVTNTGKCDPSSFDFHAKPLAEDETSLRATIECLNNNQFKVINVTENKQVTDLTTLNVACTTKTCTRCGSVDRLNDKGPMRYTVGNGCAELTSVIGNQMVESIYFSKCTNDLIEIEGAPATAAKPFCKEHKEGTGDFRWAIVHPVSGETLPFTVAACPKTVKCNNVRKLDIECESTACDMIDPTLSKITCEIGYRLAIKSAASPKWSIIENIGCESEKGLWMKASLLNFLLTSKKTEPLGEGEKIKCLTAKEADAAQRQHVEPTDGGSTTSTEKSNITAGSSMSIGTVIAIAIVGILVIMIIAGFGFTAVRKRRAKEEKELGEVDAKPPTPPATDKDSDKYNAAEVSFSGSNRPPTPSLKTSKDESDPLKFTNARVQPSPAPSGKQFEDAPVSVTAHIPCPPSGGSSDKPSDKTTIPAPRPAPPPPTPDSVEMSKKKVAELLDQSVPSMSE